MMLTWSCPATSSGSTCLLRSPRTCCRGDKHGPAVPNNYSKVHTYINARPSSIALSGSISASSRPGPHRYSLHGIPGDFAVPPMPIHHHIGSVDSLQ